MLFVFVCPFWVVWYGVYMLKRMPLRHLIMMGALLVLIIVAAIFRRFGLGELALLLGFFAIVFVIEAGVFVARRFLRGLRGR